MSKQNWPRAECGLGTDDLCQNLPGGLLGVHLWGSPGERQKYSSWPHTAVAPGPGYRDCSRKISSYWGAPAKWQRADLEAEQSASTPTSATYQRGGLGQASRSLRVHVSSAIEWRVTVSFHRLREGCEFLYAKCWEGNGHTASLDQTLVPCHRACELDTGQDMGVRDLIPRGFRLVLPTSAW